MVTRPSRCASSSASEAVGLVAEHERGRRRRGRPRGRACRRSASAPSRCRPSAAQRVERLHRMTALPRPGSRRSRRPRRERPWDCTHRPIRGSSTIAAAPAASALRSSVPTLPGSASSTPTSTNESPGAGADGSACRHRRHRQHRLRRHRRAEPFEHALLQLRRLGTPASPCSVRRASLKATVRARPEVDGARARRHGRARPRPRVAPRRRTPAPHHARAGRASSSRSRLHLASDAARVPRSMLRRLRAPRARR